MICPLCLVDVERHRLETFTELDALIRHCSIVARDAPKLTYHERLLELLKEFRSSGLDGNE
jgi:hypothetical protein